MIASVLAATVLAATLWPVPPPVTAEFDPPVPDWLPGHRGLDMAGPPGTVVRTPRAGVVSYRGVVAGVPVVVVTHGAVRATYQPVRSHLAVGTVVPAGAPIGVVAARAVRHCADACLHWGLRTETGYLDPRLLLGRLEVVLEPTDP